MDYCTNLFGKKLYELQFRDIEEFFKVERAETDQMEFKSYAGSLDKNVQGLTKSVCGFLNSKGGLIILGAPLGSTVAGKTEKIFVGALTIIKEEVAKDRLISKISDKIISLPHGVRLQVVEGKTGEFVCVFEIDESDYSPHQTDGTYYMRMDGQTRPAPHHYVEAQFRKIRYPNLEAYLVVTKSTIERTGTTSGFYNLSFDIQFHNWSPLQNVEELTYNVIVHPGKFIQTDKPEYYAPNGGVYERRSSEKVIHYGWAVLTSYEIKISSEAAQKVNHKAKILVFFGGKNCPSKSSEYEIDLTKSTAGINVDSQMVIRRKENRLFKDIQDELGQNRESILKSALGRDVV